MAATSLEFSVLGPLEVRRAGCLLDLRGTKQRSVLAALLLSGNKTVSAARLIDELWGEAPPETAANTLQVYVSQLRKLLEPGVSASESVLQTRPPGYSLTLCEGQLDLHRFEGLLVAGREAVLADEFEAGSAQLRAAQALWRGPCLSELPLQGSAQAAAAAIGELRLAAYEDLIMVELALGRHGALVPELEALIVEHPYRESLRAHLMLALYRSGRQADALEVFRRGRETLVEELGIEPSRELQRLEQEILRQDATLELVPRAPRSERARAEKVAQRTERRKTIAVAVVDVAVESGEWRALDPELLAGLTERAVAAVEQCASRHHGVLYRVAGGRAIVVFGAARAHEDDALRAARAALDVAAAVEALSAELSGARLVMRAAVEAGVAVVGRDGSGELSISGNVVSAAERAAVAAGRGEVLLGPTAQSLLVADVRLHPAPAGEAIPDFACLLEVERGPSVGVRRHAAALVGRVDEVAELRHALARVVRERRCLLVTLLGEAGIGKSRLALELGNDLVARVVRGTCRSYGERVTFAPLGDVLTELVGGELSEVAVATLLGGDEEAGRVAELVVGALGGEPVAATEEVFRAVRRLLEVVARERPLVVVFDDVHWAEPTFLDLVEHLAEWSQDAPLLLLCLARPELIEERPAWGSGRINGATLLLEPLPDADSKALINQLAAGQRLPKEATRRIRSVAGGNPFFVEQLLAVAAQETGYAEELSAPPSVQALLSARLDGLPVDERQLLEHAAVVGDAFLADALAALLPAPLREKFADSLERLAQRKLLRPLEPGLRRSGSYAFAHALIHEAAYEALPKRERAYLHARYGEWLLESESQPPAELDALVGYHLERAYLYRQELAEPEELLGKRAAIRLTAGGRRAYATGDMPRAVSLLSRAARLLPANDSALAETLAELGEALRDAGELERAEATLHEAIAVARTTGAAAAEASALAVGWQIRLQTDTGVSFEEAAEAFGQTIDTLEQLGHERGLAKAWVSLAEVPYLRGQAASSEQALERGLAHARSASDTRTEALAMNALVGVVMSGPTPVSAAIQRCEEILGRTSGQDRVAAAALRALAGLSAMEGRFADAWQYVARDRAILLDLGLRIVASSSATIAGLVGLLEGDLPRAEAELRWGYGILAEIGDQNGLATVAAPLAEVLLLQGQDEEALAVAGISRDCAAVEDIPTQVAWRGPAAKALARRGDAEQAERLAREAVGLGEQTDFLDLRGNALLDLAEVLQIRGNTPDAATAAEAAAALFTRKGNLVSLAKARAAATAGSPATV